MRRRCSFCAFVHCWRVFPTAGNSVIYAVLDLGAPTHVSCRSINPAIGESDESGLVVGSACGALLWSSGSETQRPWSLPEGTASVAFGLNSSGVVAGGSGYVDHSFPCVWIKRNRGAFVWSSTTDMGALGVLPESSGSIAFDISDAGYVAGVGDSRGVLWSGETGSATTVRCLSTGGS